MYLRQIQASCLSLFQDTYNRLECLYCDNVLHWEDCLGVQACQTTGEVRLPYYFNLLCAHVLYYFNT